VSPVKYVLGFYIQKTTFFIVTAVKTSNLTYDILFANPSEITTRQSLKHMLPCVQNTAAPLTDQLMNLVSGDFSSIV
jgi:hypothetical protein